MLAKEFSELQFSFLCVLKNNILMGSWVPAHIESTIAVAQVVLMWDDPPGTCRQELYSLFSVFVHMAVCPVHRKAGAVPSGNCGQCSVDLLSLMATCLYSVFHRRSELRHAHVSHANVHVCVCTQTHSLRSVLE